MADLGLLGWQGELQHGSPEVVALRERLAREGGIPDIELVDPAQPGFAARAAELLRRDGYVCVKDVLDEARLATIRAGLEKVIRSIVTTDPTRVGNRGSHRYSCGNVECTHVQEAWAALVDPPALMAVLAEVFETEDFICTNGTGGADFTLPGALDFQHLHSDGAGDQEGTFRDVKLGTRPDGSTFWVELPQSWDKQANRPKEDGDDPSCTYRVVNYRELPISHLGVTVNFPMEVGGEDPGGQTAFNGATRQIPGTQGKTGVVRYSEEPLLMKMAMVAPAPAGCALIRDSRAWHGGCPNLSRYVRAIPRTGYAAPIYRQAKLANAVEPGSLDPSQAARGRGAQVPMRSEVYESLTPRGQEICAALKALEGERIPPPQFTVQGLGMQHTEQGFVNTRDQPIGNRLKLARL